MSDLPTSQPANSTRPQRLQEYQAMLARRLHAAQTQTAQAGYLGVQIGVHHYLVGLEDAGEIMPLQDLTPVPLTQPWYLGVLSTRGQLLGVADFDMFAFQTPTPVDMTSRIMVLSKNPERACGVLVTKLFGLRPSAGLQTLPDADANPAHPWLGQQFQADDGQIWQVLDVKKLLEDPSFLQVGR